MKKNRIFILVGILVVLVISCVISSKEAKNETYKIGAAFALTGDAGPWGEASLNSAELAVSEINKAGGINGKPLELVVEDIKSSSKDSVTAVSKLVNIDKVDAVMITWLDSYQGSQSVVPANTLLISQDAAIEAVNEPTNYPNVFSLWYRTESKAKAIFNEIVRSKLKTVYLVTQNDSYYSKLVEFLKLEAKKNNIQIVGEESLTSDSDTRTVISKIKNAKPDVVFFGSYDEKLNVDFLKRYNELIGTKVTLYGDEFIQQNFDSKNFDKKWLEGIKFYVPSDVDANFKKKYVEKYNTEPVFSAGTTYDTVYVIAKYFSGNPENLNEYMRTTQFDTTTYGTITFDKIGGVLSGNEAITMKQVVGGKIVPVK